MKTSSFLSGPSAGSRQPGRLHAPQRVVASPSLDSQALACPGAVTREASAGSWADRSPGPATVHAIVRWLRRAIADAARAWALAAGVPPGGVG